MTQEHPITPPPELVEKWAIQSPIQHNDETWAYELFIADQAARWGANEELEACINEIYKGVGLRHVDYSSNRESLCSDLRAARRPKPPSLKEQALAVLDDASDRLDAAHENIIRRALEQLDD